jgi:hypothetical protein
MKDQGIWSSEERSGRGTCMAFEEAAAENIPPSAGRDGLEPGH